MNDAPSRPVPQRLQLPRSPKSLRPERKAVASPQLACSPIPVPINTHDDAPPPPIVTRVLAPARPSHPRILSKRHLSGMMRLWSLEQRTVMSRGPLYYYRQRVTSGDLQPDPAQELAAEKLESLHHALINFRPRSARNGWKERFGLARRASMAVPQGLYLYGGVGRGKSMLMDVFFQSAPVQAKRRVHFHAFMQEIHERLRVMRQEPGFRELRPDRRVKDYDILPALARDIARECWLLCFDELQVQDIADAMILGRLFEVLFESEVVVVATSNRPPRDLYKDGLQRESFLPFIALIENKLDTLHLDSAVDYRLTNLRNTDLYITPLDDLSDQRLEATFAKVTQGQEITSEVIQIHGRVLTFPRVCHKICFSTFPDLCQQNLGPADYLAIAERFDMLFIARIPTLNPSMRNEAKRFVTLVDALYEHKVKLICSAERPPENLYPAGDGAFEFQRTASRLFEMQSQEYISGKGASRAAFAPRDAASDSWAAPAAERT